MNSKDEMSPLDSWIRIYPGEGIGLNKQTQEMWINSARGFRKMRGDILTACFEIENVLDEIIGEVFFPGLSRAPEGSAAMADPVAHCSNAALKNAFTRIFLRASANTFGRKVGLFRDTSKEIRQLGDLLTDQLNADLDRVLKIRNGFAHFPITFEMRASQPGPEFAALILIAGQIVELTQPICQEYKALVSSTAGLLRGVMGKLQSNTNREGESILSKNGIVWLGHIALGDDAWRVGDPEAPLNTADFWVMGSRPGLKFTVGCDERESNKDTGGG